MRNIFLALVACTFLFASQESKIVFDQNSSNFNGIYNYTYSQNTSSNTDKFNVFLNGNFDAIHRYDALYFDGESLDDDSNETLSAITKQIHSYEDDNSSEIAVSIIAYTQKIEIINQAISTDSAYTNFFQSIAQRDNLNPDNALDDALRVMNIVHKEILDNNISEEIIYTESRIGKANLYTEEFSQGRDKNNRVNVTIYMKKKPKAEKVLLESKSIGSGD